METAHNYFTGRLLEWYREHRRDLPWRRTGDPYHIWVSEIMLQQTRVETVIPYFERFIALYPTVDALAQAPEEEVLKQWEGLGYYSRARNLQAAVREVHEQYGGRVPDEPSRISALKGVGPYTAGAILSIAYNKPEPAVDGNVMRVLARYFLIQEDITKGSTRTAMEGIVRGLMPEGAAGDFTQAMMELGALVCTPRSPSCLTCPVMERCAGRLEGVETSLPVKTKAKAPRPEDRLAALVVEGGTPGGRVLIRQRPDEGLLARMWELPHWLAGEAGAGAGSTEAQRLERAAALVGAETGLLLEPEGFYMAAEHTFSHIHWNLRVYRLDAVDADRPLPEHYRWFHPDELQSYAFPNVFLRILKSVYSGAI